MSIHLKVPHRWKSHVAAHICISEQVKNKVPAVEPLLTWKVAAQKVPWGLLFLLGGGFAMAFASEVSFLIDTNCQELNVFIYSHL